MQDLYSSVQNHQVYFSYFGKFTDVVTSNIIDMLEPLLIQDPAMKKVRKKASFLIAECFQNVVRHSIDESDNSGVLTDLSAENFQIAINDREINITSVNVVEKSKVRHINEMIDEVNARSQEDLKALRNSVLAGGAFSDKGGAGLGIIEMARKTGLPIRKKFRLENDGKITFVMTIDLVFGEINGQPSYDLETFEKLYDDQKVEGVVLAYKGDLSKEASFQLIELLESRFIEDQAAGGKHVAWFHVMVELLQNASKHGTRVNGRIPGYFGIQLKRDEKNILAGNYLNNHQANILKNSLEHITSLDEIALRNLYLSTLGNPISALSNAGLGLLEIAKISNNRIDYSIVPARKGGSFYSVGINLS